MNLVIAGGGTGGHVYPAIALAGEFIRQVPGAKVTFIGAEKGLEVKVIPPLGYDLIALPVQGVVGSAALTGIRRGASLLRESMRVLMILKKLKPDLVVGVGGYASVPAVCAAAVRGIPRSIIEQNVMPGRANRVLARIVQRIYQGFASRSELFPTEKTVVTGNPIRKEVLPPPDLKKPEGRISLLILGGSQGARQINDLAINFVPRLLKRFPVLTVLHQAGPLHAAGVQEEYKKNGATVKVVDFIDDMANAYGEADLCISRAGAMAVSELAAAGLPAVLIPYPHAAGGHQDLNAKWLEDRGGAVAVDPAKTTGDLLYEEISIILENPLLMAQMAQSSRRAGVRDAAERIVRAELERIGLKSAECGVQSAEERRNKGLKGKMNDEG